MFKSKKIDIVVLLIAFVLLVSSSQAVLASPAGGKSKTGAQATRTKFFTVRAAAFTPSTDGYDFYNSGHTLYVGDAGSTPEFVAPVKLPHNAVIKSITLIVQDLNPGGRACVTLFVDTPILDNKTQIRKVCSQGSSGNMQSQKKTMSLTVPDYKGIYLVLDFTATSVEVYAVKIGYK